MHIFIFLFVFGENRLIKMSITIKMPICRVCLQSGNAINIYTGDILEKFVYTTLVQVSTNHSSTTYSTMKNNHSADYCYYITAFLAIPFRILFHWRSFPYRLIEAMDCPKSFAKNVLHVYTSHTNSKNKPNHPIENYVVLSRVLIRNSYKSRENVTNHLKIITKRLGQMGMKWFCQTNWTKIWKHC